MVQGNHFIKNRDHETSESFLFFSILPTFPPAPPTQRRKRACVWQGRDRAKKNGNSRWASSTPFENLPLSSAKYSGKLMSAVLLVLLLNSHLWCFDSVSFRDRLMAVPAFEAHVLNVYLKSLDWLRLYSLRVFTVIKQTWICRRSDFEWPACTLVPNRKN